MQLKSNLRNVCQKYKIKVPYKYQDIIYSFINNDTIKVWKQDKGRGVVVTDCSKYAEKCLEILEIDQSAKIKDESTKMYREQNSKMSM